jgi:uncharacterized membrane protein YeaQ/YmgE (transglycosylase-associated protein family)
MMSWSVVNAAPAKLKPEHGAGNLLRNADASNRGLCRNRFLFSVSPWVRPHSESYEKRPNSRAKSVTGPIEVIFEHNGKPANQDIAVKQNFPLRFSAFAVYGLLPRLNATSEYGSLFMLGLLGVLIIGLIVGAIAKLIVPGKEPGGCLVTSAIGVAGSFAAFYLGTLLGWTSGNPDSLRPVGFFPSLIGAVILLLVYHWIRRRFGR